MDYRPWGRKESDTTEGFSLHFTSQRCSKPVPKTLPSITWNLVEIRILRLPAPGTWYQSWAPCKIEKPCSQKDQKASGWVFENVSNIRSLTSKIQEKNIKNIENKKETHQYRCEMHALHI